MVKPWPDHLEYPEIPVFEMLKESAKIYPEHVAISFMGKETTYKELDLLSDKFATALATLGVKKGDRVAIFMVNVPQFVIAYYGILKVGDLGIFKVVFDVPTDLRSMKVRLSQNHDELPNVLTSSTSWYTLSLAVIQILQRLIPCWQKRLFQKRG